MLHCLRAAAGFAGIEVYQNGALLPHRLVQRKGRTLIVIQAVFANDDYTVLQLHTKMKWRESFKKPTGVLLQVSGSTL